MPNPPVKALLVDGHYYLYRSFFAIQSLKSPDGRPTNAVFGFAKTLRKMLADLRPTHAAVVWDRGLPARRIALQPAYKQQRPEMPPDLREQQSPIVEMCRLFGLSSISAPDTEADDLIASYARQSPAGAEILIATNDKDLLQLADQSVRIYSTAKADVEHASSTNGFALLGADEVTEKWGVPPSAILDVLSLAGDQSDNIPGVPGIGEKTAVSLIRQFGSTPHLLASLEQIPSPKLRAKLERAAGTIHANREMVRLEDDLPLPLPWDALALAPHPAALLSFFRDCGFRSLSAQLEADIQSNGQLEFEPPSLNPAQTAHASPCPPALSQAELFD